MRFYATDERALRTAKRLRDEANHAAAIAPVTLGAAKEALAAAWGYSGWQELAKVCEASPRSPFDEDATPEVAFARFAYQAAALARVLKIEEAQAMDLVARCGLTSRTPPASAPRPAAAAAAHGPSPARAPIVPMVPGFRVPDLDTHVLGLGGSVMDRGLLALGILASHLSEGRGCLFVDASGDASSHAAIRAMVAEAGEPEGSWIVDCRGPVPRGREFGTFNPFATEDAAGLARMLVGMHDANDTLADSDRVGMTVVAMSALGPLVERRDAEGAAFRTSDVAGALRGLAASSPGAPLDGHGAVVEALCGVLDALGDTHGAAFDAEPTLDPGDAMARGRTVLVLLDPEPRGRGALAGHAVMAVLRRVAAGRLGTPLAGRWEDAASVPRAPVPKAYGVVLDGVGRYASAPDRALFSQARSLGLMMAYLAGDAGELRASGRETSRHVVGNTATRVLMRSDDPDTRVMAAGLSAGLRSDPPASPLVDGEGVAFKEGMAWVASMVADGNARRVRLALEARRRAA